jgi:hypothetical protein
MYIPVMLAISYGIQMGMLQITNLINYGEERILVCLPFPLQNGVDLLTRQGSLQLLTLQPKS